MSRIETAERTTRIATKTASSRQPGDNSRNGRIACGVAYVAMMTVLFAKPISALALFAANSDLHSHILLIPLITMYLLYIRRSALPKIYRSSLIPAAILGAIGVGVLVMSSALRSRALSDGDIFTLTTFSFVCCVVAGGFGFLGAAWMRAAAFPAGFLFFMIPLPDAAVVWLENGLKLASAEAADLFFTATGMPFYREGATFQIPGITVEVARECSGIRSSWVLLLTTVLAADLFLQTAWRKAILVLFSIPLGILRNGFRILVIGWLCMQIGPQMINSPIHHQGGPLFFVLSLIPLVAVLWALRRSEGRTKPARNQRQAVIGAAAE